MSRRLPWEPVTTRRRRRARSGTVVLAVLVVVLLGTDPRAGAQAGGDDFDRAALGSGWVVQAGNVGVVDQRALGLTAQSGIGIASWAGSTPGQDQFSEAVLAPDKAANMLVQVFVRRRSSDGARYGFHYDDDPNDSSPGPDEWQIKFDGVPTSSTRLLATAEAGPPQPGDSIRLEVAGTNPVELRGYHNGRLVVSAVDAAPEAVHSGPPGVAFRLKLGTTTSYPSAVIDQWSGGSTTMPPPTLPPPPTDSPPPDTGSTAGQSTGSTAAPTTDPVAGSGEMTDATSASPSVSSDAPPSSAGGERAGSASGKNRDSAVVGSGRSRASFAAASAIAAISAVAAVSGILVWRMRRAKH